MFCYQRSFGSPTEVITAEQFRALITAPDTETVRDTVYQTRTVTKYVKPLTAQTSPVIDQKVMDNQIIENDAEQAACSMLCDNIPYALLATP